LYLIEFLRYNPLNLFSKEALPMEIELFTVCDFAEDMGNGKLVIVGIFDNITVKEFPATHPMMMVVAKVYFQKKEAGKHNLKVVVADPDGFVVVPNPLGEVEVKFAEGQERVAMNLVLAVGQMKLTKAGRYTVSLEIDDQPMRTISFNARQK
jgi:hypothetical protein